VGRGYCGCLPGLLNIQGLTFTTKSKKTRNNKARLVVSTGNVNSHTDSSTLPTSLSPAHPLTHDTYDIAGCAKKVSRKSAIKTSSYLYASVMIAINLLYF